MYKKILVPTDGSELSEKAADHAIQLAKTVGADLIILTVTLPWSAIAIGEIAVALPLEDYENRSELNAQAFLKSIAKLADKAEVAHESLHVQGSNPYEAIIAVAKENECDLIVMGSHGRRGVEGFLLGSETVDVLTHTSIPVLVCR